LAELLIRERQPVSVRRAVGQFVLTGLAALVLVAGAGTYLILERGTAASLRDSATVADLVAHGVIAPAITTELLDGDPQAIREMDALVRDRVLRGALARVKVWTPDGRIVYSDEPLLIGATFPLTAEQSEVLATGGMSEPHLSDLTAAENEHEGGPGRLAEVYVQITGPDGRPLLVESYVRPDSVLETGRFVADQMLPIVVVALVFLAVAQWPLGWRLARDLRVGHEARERLLRSAIESSHAERRRIAGDLHDGLVQSLAGVAFDLAGTADRTPDPDAAARLQRGAEGVRSAMREARSVLVDLYPPNLQSTSLGDAVTDLAARVSGRGIAVTTDVRDDDSLDDTDRLVVYRVAQEALRNVVKHSSAHHVEIRLAVDDGACRLRIEDDGVGFDENETADKPKAGHLGLSLLRDLAGDAGARLEVRSRRPAGTVLALELGSPA
jgi:two-component system NarL family sensor kinase